MKRVQASLTVEASFVMPLVILVGVSFLYMIKILDFQMELYTAMADAADLVSAYSYTYDEISSSTDEEKKESQEEGLMSEYGDPLITTALVYSSISGKVDSSLIVGGFAGIYLGDSSIRVENEKITITAVYYIKIPIMLNNSFTIKQCLRLCTRAFTGDNSYAEANKDNESDTTYVYITETGTVYHTDENCSYLNPKISQISKQQIEGLRNSSGAKYYQCRICIKQGQTPDNLYVCTYGTRYHSDINCRELKRSIKKVSIDEVKEMRECAKCKSG